MKMNVKPKKIKTGTQNCKDFEFPCIFKRFLFTSFFLFAGIYAEQCVNRTEAYQTCDCKNKCHNKCYHAPCIS